MTSVIHTMLTKTGRWPLFVLSFVYCAFIFLYHDSFKLGLLASVGVSGLFYWVTRDVFTSLFCVFMLSAFFLFPSKNYTFLYASPLEYNYELLPRGIFETITIGIAEIFGLFLVLFFVRERIKNNAFTKLLNDPLVIGILVSWFIYYSISLFSSLQFSPFPFFSLDILMLSGKMVIVFLGAVYLFAFKNRLYEVFFITLLAALLLQNIIGLKQFIFNLSPTGSVTTTTSTDVEERTSFRRVQGITNHPNTHAFNVLLLSIVCMPFVIKRRKQYGWIFLLSLLNIVFSQSRTVWALLALQSVLVVAVYYKNARNYISILLNNPRVVAYVIIIGGLFALITVPRLNISSIFFSEEGGGGLRIKMISQGWKLLQQAPWTGFGAGTNVRVFLNKMPSSYISGFPFSIHFTPLQIALESGIPATISFFLPFYIIIHSLLDRHPWKRLHNTAVMSAVCGMILIVGYCLVQPIYTRGGYFLIGVFMGFAVVQRKALS